MRFAAESKSAASHFRSAMKTELKALKFVRIKMVDHTEELQLITPCDNWENVEARAQ